MFFIKQRLEFNQNVRFLPELFLIMQQVIQNVCLITQNILWICFNETYKVF